MKVMLDHFAVVVVTAAILNLGCTNAAQEPQFKITTQRESDKVEIKVEQGMTVVSAHSPFGISQAMIERTDGSWPDTVILRLYLKGLENFKVANGKVTLEAAVSNQDGTARQWKDGKEDEPLDAKSPYWLEIRTVGDDEKLTTTRNLDDRYFEIHLPKAVFDDNPKSITVNWIDFYR